MKGLFGLLLVSVVIFHVVYTAKHNISFGNRLPGDRLVFNRTVQQKGSFMQVQKANVTFNSTLRLSFINVTDNYTNGNGGFAALIKGGPGSFNATLQLKSQRSHGFNFTILMYGR